MSAHNESDKPEADKWEMTCSQENEISENLLAGCGNPLLAIIAYADDQVLSKYRRDQHMFASDMDQHLYQDEERLVNTKYVAAGSVYNAMRIFQWIVQKPLASTYLGCVGEDSNAHFLLERARADGVNARFQYTNAAMTGRCLMLMTPNNDCHALVAEPGAAAQFSMQHMRKYSNRKLLANAKFHFTSTYFLDSNRECAMELAKLAHQLSTTFFFKLAPKFLVEKCAEDLKAILPYVDVVFSGEASVRSLGAIFGWERKIKVIAQKIFQLPKKNPQRQRIVVILRNLNPVLVVQEDSIREYPAPKLTPLNFDETNGADDAFIGAFLSQYVQGKEMSVCMLWGIWAAKTIIQSLSSTYEGRPIIKGTWLTNYMENALGAGIYSPHAST